MKEFFGRLAKAKGCGSADIVELDYQLHRLLHRASKNNYLNKNLVFKGGTCLIKAYTGYFRFSQDVDFTWGDDTNWNGLSGDRLNKRCSSEISNIIDEFKETTDELGLSFSGKKKNSDEVHISSGGKMAELRLKYKSEVLGVPSELKVQVNMVDMISFPVVTHTLSSYVDGVDLSEVKLFYPEPCSQYCTTVDLACYDSREIYAEKCRAAMTRMAYKPRDILDIIKMEKEFGYSIDGLRKPIIEKTRFVLDKYERYGTNMKQRVFPKNFSITSFEEKLLLEPVTEDIDVKARRIHSELTEVIDEVLKN